MLWGGLLLSGCSSIAVNHPLAVTDDQPIVVDYCIESTAEMNILDKGLSGEQNKARFHERIDAALADVHAYLKTHFVQSPNVTLRQLATCSEPLTGKEADARLSLTLDISGYGSIKPKWKAWLIGTGAVEAVAQGVIVFSVTQNPWLGLAMSSEEMTSEYLTWNGVDWALGETYAPVTLEGRLTDAKDKKVIWADSYFVTENDEETKAISAPEKKDKTRQLAASLHEAERKLFKGLNNYLDKQVL